MTGLFLFIGFLALLLLSVLSFLVSLAAVQEGHGDQLEKGAFNTGLIVGMIALLNLAYMIFGDY